MAEADSSKVGADGSRCTPSGASLTWNPLRSAFCSYLSPAQSSGEYSLESHGRDTNNLRKIVKKSLVAKVTKGIVETFQACNPAFRYSESLNPKRFLTNPSTGVLNDGFDNANSDLILYVNFELVNSETKGRYIVKDALGQGTFGQVAKCWDLESNKYVAVKIIKNQPAYYQQAVVEFSILDMLNKKYDPDDKHHIVRILDYFVFHRHLCISFEMLGSNLYELIKMNHFKGLSLNIVQAFSKQILHALVVMKDAGIIHCDMKPENILMSARLKPPQIKVIDFGSACMEGRTVYSYIQSRYYRSPEVLLGYPYTTSIDMWSFGCIVAELFLGLPLFPGASEYDLLNRMIEILGGQPPDSLLRDAKNTSKFFKHVGSIHHSEKKLSIGEVQRLEWDALEAKIRRWIRAARICVRIVFASERRLCERIFDGLGIADEAPFTETVKGAAIQLFGFAEAISIGRRTPEKLFKIIDLHDTISDLLPDVGVVFQSKSAESIYTQATEILSRLAEAIRGILSEFENAVLRDPPKTPVPGGTIHPLTRYVMNYINLISDYKPTLMELIVTRPSASTRLSGDDFAAAGAAPLELDFPESENQTPLAAHLSWIIVVLQHNLENKAALYKDNALLHLFLMNNIHYIVQKVKGSSELREMIGDDYLRKLTGKFRLSATSYQRATWVRILHCLRDEGIHVSGSFSSGVSKSTLRERFKSFNASFDEAHKTQANWVVPDTQLREELRISISEKLLPAYRAFLGRFRQHIESGRHPELYIKYSVEDLEMALSDFFEGSSPSLHNRRRSQ